jgi:hypothetical protein
MALSADTILRAWEHDTPAKFGGFMELAGIDPADAFRVRKVTDHPWLGLTVRFPFPEVGEGRIVNCLTHPYGKLMFDVVFAEPVPPIQGIAPRFRAVLKDNPAYHQLEHRFFGDELLALSQLADSAATDTDDDYEK